MKIAPSLLSADFANLQRDVQEVDQAGADWIHIDVMDGSFVPNLTFGPNLVQAIRPHTNLPLDVHLMVNQPEKFIAAFAKAGADCLSVQVESTQHIHRAIQLIKDQGLKAGAVVNPGTPNQALTPLLRDLDYVLVMTVNPGFGGQAFIPTCLDKIGQLAQTRTKLGLDFEIQVDGGINDQTAKQAQDVGADIFVAGSYIFSQGKSPKDQIAKLRKGWVQSWRFTLF